MKIKLFKNKKVKNSVIGGIIVVLCGGGLTSYILYNNAKKNAPNTKFTTTTVKLSTISTSISASGTVSNSAQIDLIPSSGGTLDTLNVKEGDAIKTGDLLAKVTDSNSALTIQSAKNAVSNQTQALAKLVKSKTSLYTKAATAGRVKNVNIAVGDDLANAKSLGSIMVISTDGNLKASVNYDSTKITLAQSDVVDVSIKGAVVAQGTIASINQGQGSSSINVLVPDTLTVGVIATFSKAGTTIGSAALSVNAPVEVQGTTGTITNLYVSENSTVSKGSNLFKIDGTELDNNIASQTLSVTQAENDLAAKQASVGKNSLTSPVTGIVATINYNLGDSIPATKAVLTVLDPNKMQTVVSVDELDIGKVKMGQAATVTLDAIPGKTFNGTVTRISNVGTVASGVTTYSVTIAIDKGDAVKVGMTSSVSIIVEKKENVLVIPVSALASTKSAQGSKAVYISTGLTATTSTSGNVSAGAPRSNAATLNSSLKTQSQVAAAMVKNITTIKTGMQTSTLIEVTSGLKEGDIIAIPVVTKATTTAAATTATTKTTTKTSNATGGFGGGDMGGPPTGGVRPSGN
ncbi:MAG: HlyD family efflux transporter periplasmic adaptor subunit [Clostridiaceae bacterium]|nr:HlyD family efflux transporter periplasmic adaptor subunit [Clostridiaceae bacterium]